MLLFAAFQRGRTDTEVFRRMAEADAALAKLADDETAFYVDIGRLFRTRRLRQ
jgi:hypothetical protein